MLNRRFIKDCIFWALVVLYLVLSLVCFNVNEHIIEADQVKYFLEDKIIGIYLWTVMIGYPILSILLGLVSGVFSFYIDTYFIFSSYSGALMLLFVVMIYFFGFGFMTWFQLHSIFTSILVMYLADDIRKFAINKH